jgi:hypothetical protein
MQYELQHKTVAVKTYRLHIAEQCLFLLYVRVTMNFMADPLHKKGCNFRGI